jgi:GT2 family glycosyltransferase
MPAETATDAVTPVAASIAVLVVNWNGKAHLERCLGSVLPQLASSDVAVLVDNGSSDGSRETALRLFPGVIVIDTGSNLGFAEACNRGLAEIDRDWVFILNNDAAIDAGCIDELREVARGAGERVGMIQTRMLFARDRSRINSTGLVIRADGSAADRDAGEPVRETDCGIEEIFCPTAGAALYRKRMLDGLRLTTGVFDRTFFMYCEDWDLGWRARLCGWSALYAPKAIVEHALQGSAHHHPHGFVITQVRLNNIRTMLKNATARRLALSLPGRLKEIRLLICDNGWRVLGRIGAALRDGLRQRREVRALACVPAIEVETRWLAIGSARVKWEENQS